MFRRLIILALIVGGGILVARTVADGAVRKAVEQASTDSLGVTTTLESVRLGFFDADCAIGGLTIANPPGFTEQPFLTMREGHVAVTMGSLMDDVVEVPTLTLDGATINVEMRGDRANYDVLLDNIKRNADDGEGRRFIIRELKIREVDVRASLSPLAEVTGTNGSLATIRIPEIVLRDVGSESDGGVLLSELGNLVVEALLAGAAQHGATALPKRLIEDLGGALQGLPGLENFEIEGIEGVGSALKKGVEDATKTLENLFGK